MNIYIFRRDDARDDRSCFICEEHVEEARIRATPWLCLPPLEDAYHSCELERSNPLAHVVQLSRLEVNPVL